MTSGWEIFWTVMVFASVLWYAGLLVYVAWRGGREILQLARRMRQDPSSGAPMEVSLQIKANSVDR